MTDFVFASKPRSEQDIRVGINQWIEFIDVIDGRESWVSVDEELSRISELWEALATFCEPACCGLDALDFSPANIAYALTFLGSNQVLPKLEEVLYLVQALPAKVVASQLLNAYMDKKVLLHLLHHLRINVANPADLRPRGDFVFTPKRFLDEVLNDGATIEVRITALVLQCTLSEGYTEALLTLEFIGEALREEPASVNAGVNIALERGLIMRRPYKDGFAYAINGIEQLKSSGQILSKVVAPADSVNA